MSQSAGRTPFETFRITRRAVDPRADGGCRTVHVGASQVMIERVLRGVRMRIAVPVASYDHLVVASLLPVGRAMLRLRHDDPDLDVTIATGEATAIAQGASDWAVVLGKAIVVERACVSVRGTLVRRTRRTRLAKTKCAGRRSPFARRRATGSLQRLGRSFADEHEIIARD